MAILNMTMGAEHDPHEFMLLLSEELAAYQWQHFSRTNSVQSTRYSEQKKKKKKRSGFLHEYEVLEQSTIQGKKRLEPQLFPLFMVTSSLGLSIKKKRSLIQKKKKKKTKDRWTPEEGWLLSTNSGGGGAWQSKSCQGNPSVRSFHLPLYCCLELTQII